MPVLQAHWGSRYLGKALLQFDSDGALQSLTGEPILLGCNNSQHPVAQHADSVRQIRAWKYW